MATLHQGVHNHQESINLSEQTTSCLLDDSLYCEEEKWEEADEEIASDQNIINHKGDHHERSSLLSSLFLLQQDLFWEDEELLSLFSKEQEQQKEVLNDVVLKNVRKGSSPLSFPRQEAVVWMLKVNSHYGFSNLTAILAINYLDRFISVTDICHSNDDEKPWMIHLVAVTCLSLAAKVEEIQVPLLLDLQVEDTEYVFEAKTIQRMELLVLSTLKWKMHPVTPLSFLDHIIRRLGLKTHLHWEFLRRCEHLLLSVVSDSRFVSYLPSVLAAATMMQVIEQVEPFNPNHYQHQLLSVLKISKEKVKGCYELIHELSKSDNGNGNGYKKRKHEAEMAKNPNGVIDGGGFVSSDNSIDSWGLGTSSSQPPLFKKTRTQDHWVFLDIIGSPTC